MVEYSGGKLPKDVSMAAGTIGMKLTDIAEYRVGDTEVVILNKRGQKYVFDIVKLNPPATAKASKAAPTPKPKSRAKPFAGTSAPVEAEAGLFGKGGADVGK